MNRLKRMVDELAAATTEIFDTDPFIISKAITNYLNEVDEEGEWSISDIKLNPDVAWKNVVK